MVDLSASVWRDFTTDGVPASGKWAPRKQKIREWGAWLESLINAVLNTGGLIYSTKAFLDADLSPAAHTSALVVADPVQANNGLYFKVGATGVGSWTRVGDLPGYSFIRLNDVGDGTPNAIVATSSIPLPSSPSAALLVMNVFEANAGPVTIATNGASAKPLVTNTGNPLSAGYLTAGMLISFLDDGTSFRLLSDVASASIVAAAEAAAVAAEASAVNAAASAAAALAAVPNTFSSTRTVMKGLDTATITSTYLKEAGREGQFFWNGSDLSAQMVVRTVVPVTIDSGADSFAMRSATSTAINSTTDVITAAAHGFSAGDEVYPTTTVNGVFANGKYFIYFDADTAAAAGGNTDNFKMRTSLSAGAFNLTGTTSFTVKAPHKLLGGDAVIQTTTANGITAETICYAIRTDANVFKLASSWTNFIAGTAINLTGTTGVTLKHLSDPSEGRFVVKTAASLTGSAGAWTRVDTTIRAEHFGLVDDYVKGVGGTENSQAILSAIRLAKHLRQKTFFPKGHFGCAIPFGSWTADWIVVDGITGPKNGIGIVGEGSEATAFYEHTSFAGSGLIELDGNYQAVAQTVGSIPMGQGFTYLEGFSLIGLGTGSTDGLRTRGCWGMEFKDIVIREFGGNGWEVFSAVAAGPPAHDDVDSTAFISGDSLRIYDCGGSGLISQQARVAGLNIKNMTAEGCTVNGIEGCFINTIFDNLILSGNGNNGAVTRGGCRLYTSTSGAVCRDVTFIGGIFENNYNFEFNLTSVLGARWIGGGYNPFVPAVIANKSAFRIGTGNENLYFNGQKFSDYDNTNGDCLLWDISTTSKNIYVVQPHITRATSHVRLQSGNGFVLTGANIAIASSTTGSAPVNSYIEGKAMAFVSVTPLMEGVGAAGARTGGAATGVYLDDGTYMDIDFDYSQTSHTGTGNARITLSALPANFAVSHLVPVYFEGLAYTSPPQALAVAGTKTILFREVATGAAFTNIPVPASAATLRASWRARKA